MCTQNFYEKLTPIKHTVHIQEVTNASFLKNFKWVLK